MTVGGSKNNCARVAVVQAGAIPFDTQRCIDKGAEQRRCSGRRKGDRLPRKHSSPVTQKA